MDAVKKDLISRCSAEATQGNDYLSKRDGLVLSFLRVTMNARSQEFVAEVHRNMHMENCEQGKHYLHDGKQ